MLNKTNHDACECPHIDLGSLSAVETQHTRMGGWFCVGEEGKKSCKTKKDLGRGRIIVTKEDGVVGIMSMCQYNVLLNKAESLNSAP